MVAGGLPNKKIAMLLGIRERTVKFHLERIYIKMGLETGDRGNRYALIAELNHEWGWQSCLRQFGLSKPGRKHTSAGMRSRTSQHVQM